MMARLKAVQGRGPGPREPDDTDGFKIGKPIRELPPTLTRGRYDEVYEALTKLAYGEWLPVEFMTKRRADYFYRLVKANKTYNIEGHRRDTVIYLRLIHEDRNEDRKEAHGEE